MVTFGGYDLSQYAKPGSSENDIFWSIPTELSQMTSMTAFYFLNDNDICGNITGRFYRLMDTVTNYDFETNNRIGTPCPAPTVSPTPLPTALPSALPTPSPSNLPTLQPSSLPSASHYPSRCYDGHKKNSGALLPPVRKRSLVLPYGLAGAAEHIAALYMPRAIPHQPECGM